MDAFTTLNAVAVPLDQANIDTDQIIPARFLGNACATGPGRRLLPRPAARPQRPAARGRDPQQSRLQGRQDHRRQLQLRLRLLARERGDDDGRQRLPRLHRARRFGDIFFNNCFQNGCLPIRLPADRVARIRVILHELPGAEIAIDLAEQTVVGPDGKNDSFEIDPFRKDMLLKGADEVKITLGYETDITALRGQAAPGDALAVK